MTLRNARKPVRGSPQRATGCEEEHGAKKDPAPYDRSRGDANGTGPGRRAGLHSHTAEGRAPSEGSQSGMSDVKTT
jgi:hypothetical protein